MNCREAENYLFAERDGALDANQRAALSAHVTECAGCRRIRNQLAEALQSLASTTQTVRVPDADLEWQKLRREIRGAHAEPRRSLATWLGVPLAAAAAIALGLYVAPGGHRSAPTHDTTEVIAQEAPAANGATSTVVYVDDNSGWTFVWAPDVAADSSQQHI